MVLISRPFLHLHVCCCVRGDVPLWSWALYCSSRVLHYLILRLWLRLQQSNTDTSQLLQQCCSFFFFELFYFGSYFTHFVESIVNQNVGSIRRPLVSKELSEYMVIIQLEEEFKLFPVMLAAHLWLRYTWTPSHVSVESGLAHSILSLFCHV